MVENRRKRLRNKKGTERTLRRLALALPISVALHIAAALFMRPDYRKVADFAVDFQVIEVTPGQPAKGVPEPPQPQPPAAPEPTPPEERNPAPKAPVTKTAAAEPALAEPEPEPSAPAGIETGADGGAGSGICLHDLFAYTDAEPSWLLYVSMASFRDTIFQTELGNTFRSFELGRRLTRYMGMNPAESVEALFVGTDDIFDWRAFTVIASHDVGEERLKARMTERLRDHPGFDWRAEGSEFVGALPGEFEWRLMGAGRVFSISHAPPSAAPDGRPAAPIPENPFAEDAGAERPSTTEPDRTERPASGASPEDRGPRQLTCLDPAAAKRPSARADARDIRALAKSSLAPDEEGHFPVALLSTADPRSVGISRRLARRLGFSHAVFRAYFREPVLVEGVLSFAGDAAGVAALAEAWASDAKAYANDPILRLAGVSALLDNLTVQSEAGKIHVRLTLTERQVRSTLLFLQLQGRALERQLKAKQ